MLPSSSNISIFRFLPQRSQTFLYLCMQRQIKNDSFPNKFKINVLVKISRDWFEDESRIKQEIFMFLSHLSAERCHLKKVALNISKHSKQQILAKTSSKSKNIFSKSGNKWSKTVHCEVSLCFYLYVQSDNFPI